MSGSAARQRKLLVLTTDCPPSFGGIQRMVHEVGQRLSSRWEVTVLAPHDDRSQTYDAHAPFRVVRTPTPWQRSATRVIGEMARAAHGTPGDVVLAAHASLMPALVAGARGRPLVAIVHGSEIWARRTRLVTRVLGRRMGRVLANSDFTASEAAKAGIPADRIVVTPLGASLEESAPDAVPLLERLGLVDERGIAPFFVTVGRLTQPHKGQDMFVRAMPALLAREPRLRYVIAGEGPLAARLSTLAQRLGVSHAVRLTGPVDEAAKAALLRACRAFVMTSKEVRRPPLFEGFGIVYIEAALAGRPSLAGRSGGTPDAVLDGETGLLVDPRSLPDIVEGATRLLDAEFADALGRRARERASAEFTWERAVERIEPWLEAASR